MLKKITDDELKVVLEKHLLWLKSDRTQGRRADLSGYDLQGKDFQSANLRGANLWGADLEGADFGGADLERTYLNTLQKKYITASTGIGFSPDTAQMAEQLRAMEREREELKEKLEKSESENTPEDLEKLKADAEEKNKQIEQQKEDIKVLKEIVEQPIDEAAGKMRNSVIAANEARTSNTSLSKRLMNLGLGCYALAIIFILFFAFFPSLLKLLGIVCDERTTLLQFLPLYLPAIVLLTIGTALLRHEGKIRDQTSLLLEQINHAEKAAGLLQIATDLQNIPADKLESIILPTFVDIRRSLLDMTGQQPNDDNKTDGPELPPSQIKLMADIVAKTLKSSISK